MCLIAVHLASLGFTRSEFVDIFHANNDGLGAMWAEGDEVRIEKCVPRTEAAAWGFYLRVNKEATSAVVVWHWRYATHGKVNHTNAHPFRVRADAAIAHNGVIPGYGVGRKMSDTRHFVGLHLADRTEDTIDWPLIAKETRGSRLAYLEAMPGEATASIRLMGTGWERVRDIDVSNLHWQWKRAPSVSPRVALPSKRRAAAYSWADPAPPAPAPRKRTVWDGRATDAMVEASIDRSVVEAIGTIDQLAVDGLATTEAIVTEVCEEYTWSVSVRRRVMSAYPWLASAEGAEEDRLGRILDTYSDYPASGRGWDV